jgi:quercetin dioxygenase-like cupin family protein
MQRWLRILALTLFAAGIFAFGEYNKDVQIASILKTDVTSTGQNFEYPDASKDEVSVVKVTLPSGKETGWHKHNFPVFAYVLKGTLTVAIENAGTRQFLEGSSFAEVIHTFHNGKNTGAQDAVLLAFFLGEKGLPLSISK